MPKKPTPPPLFSVKHDFVDSLDAFLGKAMTLQQAVRTALDLEQIKEPAASIVKRCLAEYDAALLTNE